MNSSKTATKKKLTKVVVDALPFPDKNQQKIYWDSELSGFGVRVTPGSKTYIVEARVGGKTVRVSLGKHGILTADEARREGLKKLGEMTRGENPNKLKAEKKVKAITLGEVFEEYCLSRPLRPSSLKGYKAIVRRCLSDWLDKPVTTITKEMVLRRHKELSGAIGPRSSDKGAHAQANVALGLLGTLFNYAGGTYADGEGRSIVPENPVKRLSQAKLWNRKVRRQTVIHKKELKAWFNAVESLVHKPSGRMDRRIRDYILFCLFTGLRRTEAATLKWSEVDLRSGFLTIKPDGTKNHQEHRIPLSSFVQQLLEERYAERTGEWVFPGRGYEGHIVEVHASLQKVYYISGVKISMHDLRRTFITIADGLDISHYALKKLVNHKTSADVTAGYIASDVERLRQPMQSICDFILQEVGLLGVSPVDIENRRSSTVAQE